MVSEVAGIEELDDADADAVMTGVEELMFEDVAKNVDEDV